MNNIRLTYIFASVLAAMAVFAIYAKTLHNPFVWDDKYLIENNSFIADKSNIPDLFTTKYFSQKFELSYRPAGTALLFAGHALSGSRPEGYRAISIALHAVCSILVLLLVSAVLNAFGRAVTVSLSAGLFAALLFAAHPLATEVVNEASFNEDLLCAAFCMSAFLLFIRWRKNGRPAEIIASVALSALAMLSKENAVVFPAVVFAWIVCEPAREKRSLISAAYPVLPYALAAAAYLALRFYIMKNPSEQFIYHERGFAQTMIISARAWMEYLRLIFYPAYQCADYFSMSKPLSGLPAAVCGAGAALMLFLPFAFYRFSRAAAFASAWCLLFLLPSSNIIPISVVMAERYLYPVLPGVFLLLALAASKLFEMRENSPKINSAFSAVALPAALLLFIACAALSLNRNTAWRDEISFWKAACACAPDSPASATNLGVAYFEKGLIRESIATLESSVRIAGKHSPARDRYGNLYRAHGNLGMALAAGGQPAEAEFHLREAIRLNPGYSNARFNLASLLLRNGTAASWILAAAQLEEGLKTDPENARAREMLISIQLKLGQKDAAAKNIRKLIESGSTNAESRKNAVDEKKNSRNGH